MPRKKLIKTNEFPYHITIRCNNKEWFDLHLNTIWKICLNAIDKSNFKHLVDIHSFVLMYNHYHLLIFTPHCNIGEFMQMMNFRISKEIRKRTGRINRIFGSRYRWFLVNDNSYYWNVVKYIFQNPVRAGMVKRCEDYPYSTLYYQQRNINLPFSLPEYFNEKLFLTMVNDYLEKERLNEFRQGTVKQGRLRVFAR
ncbi:MAG: transposase [Halobacteriovoraceae bacterium]|nr:transposase [Halobacteriovoraceae bacterium]MCB9095839.1 transposase [Halobacteriovoraceae bacterium]